MVAARGSVLSGSFEYLRKENNNSVRKNKRKKSLTMNAFYMILILFLITLIGGIVYLAGTFIFSWDRLKISSYKLINAPVNEYKEVKGVLNGYRGNLLVLNLNLLKKELLEIRTIKDVTISRQLPSTIRLEFLLRKPVYQYLEQSKYIVMSCDGIALKSLDKRNEKYIEVKNIQRWDKDLLKVLYTEVKVIQNKIEYLDYDEIYGVLIKLNRERAMIYPGKINIKGKIETYLKMKKQININVDKVINVDMRIKDRIYLEFEKEV